MTKHIDTLAEWWENAEEGVIEKGDTVINRFDSETTVYVATVRTRRQHPTARILARAPKPKPAWHDAVAAIASTEGDDIRRGFVPVYDIETGEERTGEWSDWVGEYPADELYDPVPLIEAKVTDEMVDRLEHHFVATQQASLPVGFAEKMLNIALGLDPA